LSLIELLQNNQFHCKMQGGARLTFDGEFETVNDRIKIIQTLVARLRLIQ